MSASYAIYRQHGNGEQAAGDGGESHHHCPDHGGHKRWHSQSRSQEVFKSTASLLALTKDIMTHTEGPRHCVTDHKLGQAT